MTSPSYILLDEAVDAEGRTALPGPLPFPPEDHPAVAPEPEPSEVTAKLLEMAGLDHVPTAAEAKELLDARRAEIRQAVLMEADARDWCVDGTREVCANLRLTRPGNRENHYFEVTVTATLKVSAGGFTPEGAVAKLQRSGNFTPQNLGRNLYGEVVSATVTPIEVNGREYRLDTNEQEVQR